MRKDAAQASQLEAVQKMQLYDVVIPTNIPIQTPISISILAGVIHVGYHIK
jgi:hypothetical protein